MGLCGLVVLRYLPLGFIKQATPWLFCATLFLTALTFVPGIGTTIHGSHRWIYVAGFGFQPSEALKMAFVMYVGYLLAKKQYRLTSLTHGYLPLLCILGITALLLLKQPDFGQAVTLCTTAFLLFFIAHCQTKHLVITLGSALPLIGMLIYMQPYRIKRILTFLNPWDDPQGAGFQIIQSLIAIGSGNITGVGIAQSKQKFFYLRPGAGGPGEAGPPRGRPGGRSGRGLRPRLATGRRQLVRPLGRQLYLWHLAMPDRAGRSRRVGRRPDDDGRGQLAAGPSAVRGRLGRIARHL